MAANAGSATPDENSSMNDFGECTGCSEDQRGGQSEETKQTISGLSGQSLSARQAASTGERVTPAQRFWVPKTSFLADRRGWLSGRTALLD